jgi:hypothetical protein
MREYSVITTEQAGIDGQASAYSITTQKTAYDSAVTALTTYLNGLTSPTAWNDKSGNTTIVGTTFQSKFNTVYTTRQTLLNAIYAAAQALADAAQSSADNAQNTANTAQSLASQVAVLNAGFDAGDTGWTKDSGWTIQSNGSFGHGAGYAQKSGGAASAALRNVAVCFVQPGHSYTVQALIKAISANGSCYARISWRDVSDSEISTTNGNAITGTTVAGSFATGVAPAGAIFAHAEIATTGHTTGKYQVDNVVSTLQPATADEISESTSRKWAGESGADVTAGKSMTVLTDRTLDNVSDSSTYARIRANNLTSGNLDLAKPAVAGKTLANITDAGGRYAAAEAGADKTAGKSIDVLADGTNYRRVGAGYTDASNRVIKLFDGTTVRTVADTWDGANRARTGLNSAGNLVGRLATARMIAGQSFDGSADLPIPLSGLTNRTADLISETGDRKWAGETGADKTANNVSYGPNTIINPGAETGSLAPHYSTQAIWDSFATSANHSGSRVFRCTNSVDSSLYLNGPAFSDTTRQPAAREGDVWRFSGYVFDGGASPNAVSISLQFREPDGTFVSAATANVTPNGSGKYFQVFGTCPAGATVANAGVTVTAQAGHAVYFDDFELRKASVTDAGSGVTVGDNRNLVPLTFAGIGSMPTSTPISYSVSGTTVTISVAAFTLNMGGDGTNLVTISFNAAGVSTTQAAGTTITYYVYYRGSTVMQGGSQTIHLTANLSTMAQYSQVVFIGACTVTVNSGGGGSGGTGSGGGGVFPPPPDGDTIVP